MGIRKDFLEELGHEKRGKKPSRQMGLHKKIHKEHSMSGQL